MKLTGDRNQCQGCKQFFNSMFAFDKHRAGEHGRNRCCLPVDEMQKKGMCKNAAGFWISAAMTPFARSVPMREDEEAYMEANMPRWSAA